MKTAIIPNFAGKRWLKLTFRSLHLLGFAGVFASVLSNQPAVAYWWLTIVTGTGLLALEALSNLVWFIQVRALVMYIKFALLYFLFASPEYAWFIMAAMIVLSGIIAHAPSSVRYYSWWHRKKITSVYDIKG